MLIFVIILFFSIDITNAINENTTNITSLNNYSLPIEKLLNQQYDNRQITSNRPSNIRPWKKSNSIEMLKKMIANRQRSAINIRTLTSTSVTSMFHILEIRVKYTVYLILFKYKH